jgi:hypothetical protein
MIIIIINSADTLVGKEKEMELINLIGLFCLMLAAPIWADEAPFGFVHTTDLEPRGGIELEQTVTDRFQKLTDNGGYFDLLIGQTELEYGLTDNFQIGLESTYDWTQAYHNGPFGVTTPPEPFVYDVPDPNAHYDSAKVVSLSVDMIYRFLSPYKDGIGLAFNFEPESALTFAPGGFIEPSTRVILQKNFLDDTLTCAFNFTYSPELRHVGANYGGVPGPDSWNEETDVNYYFAASYRFISNLALGFEFLNEQEYISSYDFDHLANSGYYFGPSLHYADENFFLTAVFLSQLPWAVVHDATVPGAVVDGTVYDNDFEKYRLRLVAGLNL